MTEEQIKQKAEEQFPNDEFKQQSVIDAINWATKELQEKITHLERRIASIRGSHRVDVSKLKARTEQVERLKKQNKELQDYNKKLLQSDIDKHNKISLLSEKVNDLQKENAKLEEAKANYEYLLEGRDNEIDELKKQIEKMKCCENCIHHHFMGDELKCYLDYDTEFECLKTKQNWELAE